MPSLLLINFEYPPLGGGAGNATYYLGRSLAQLNCRVAVVTSRLGGLAGRSEYGAAGAATARETREGVEVFRVPVIRRRADRCTPFELLSFVASASLRGPAIVRRFRPDFCLAFMGTHSGPVAWWLRRRCGLPYAVLLRGGDVPGFMPEELGFYHRLTLPVLRRIWRDAALIIANNPGLKTLAGRQLPGRAIHVVPNGVDTDQFAPRSEVRGPVPPGRAEVRSPEPSTAAAAHLVGTGYPRSGWMGARPQPSTGPTRLLYVGRLSLLKDIPTLLRALGGLKERLSFELWLAGTGPEQDRIEAVAHAEGIDDRVRCLGWLDRPALPEIYRSVDLFVFPSRYEGMSNALLEALASGLPVVAADIPGNQDLVCPGRNGYLVPAGDPVAARAAILALAEDAALRQRMGAASRAIACERDWRSVAAEYLRLVRPLIHRA